MDPEQDEYTKALVNAVVQQRERASNEAAEAVAHVAVQKKEIEMLRERVAELEKERSDDDGEDDVPV